jgi:quinol monooxygenase YgiN
VVTHISHHKVKDYGPWRAVFDENAPVREEYSQIRERVLQSVDDPNQITAIVEWKSLENAQAYMQSPELKEGLQRLESEFVEPPTFCLLKEVD